MAAILGFLLEQNYTTPQLAELVVTPDGHVLARAEDNAGPLAYLSAEADLRANLRRFGMAAGLSEVEWAAYAERVRVRIGIDREAPSPGESATSNGMKETDPLPR